MKRVLTAALAVALFLAVLTPLILPFTSLLAPAVYDGSFVGSLADKLERLESTEGSRIVVVGGSSVAFGLKSDILERYTGMPVVNFGLYAALGTKLMLDLSRPHIRQGDIVILAPELDPQTLSLYFDPDVTLKALDGMPLSTYLDIPSEHYASMLGALWSHAHDKYAALLGGGVEYKGIYSADSFNSYGDIKAGLRAENVMTDYYDPNNTVTLDGSILSDEFVGYLNEYIGECREAGADVLFTWCPINELAIEGGADASSLSAFENALEERIDATFISRIGDSVLEAGYFYDTNFHLNDAGALLRTIRLTEDVLLELGDPTAVKEMIPDPPELPFLDMRHEGEDPNAEYFTFTRLANGSYMVSAVKDEYKGMKSLTVPVCYGGFKVTQLGQRLLAGTSAEELVITADTNITLIMNGAFNGASTLKRLVIRQPIPDMIVPPDSFDGTHPSFTVYVPVGSNYSTHYGWGDMGLKFEFIKE